MSGVIYHVCKRTEWDAGGAGEPYRGSSQDARDGFIHFSGPGQVEESVAKHRAGQDGLVLLAVDAGKLGAALKWEVSRGDALFPHLYGPLEREAVISVRDLPLGADGVHMFPPLAD
jgi:uncharacterized protein (DUF952 family)